MRAAVKVREKAIKAASYLLECAPDDLDIVGTEIRVKGTDRKIGLGEVARTLEGIAGFKLPGDLDPGLEATEQVIVHDMAFSSGSAVAEVEVDIETGQVHVTNFLLAHDCGTMINPMLVDGQVIGGIAHGISNALFEWMGFDENAQPLTNNYGEYLLVTATEMPPIEIMHRQSPSPLNTARGQGRRRVRGDPDAGGDHLGDRERAGGVRCAGGAGAGLADGPAGADRRRAAEGPRTMTASLSDIRRDLALANRLLSNEGVLDAFGHVSARHPENPERFLISVSLAPILVSEDDIVECTLDGRPVEPTERRLYSEGVIHSEIYRARPDVQAVCHHHAPKIMPFCISGEPLVPVSQLGAVIGSEAPFWDSQDEFGDTNLLLTRPEEGASLARALGPHWIVLMRRHGATVVARSVRELFFRAVHSGRECRLPDGGEAARPCRCAHPRRDRTRLAAPARSDRAALVLWAGAAAVMDCEN